ncbi:MAG: glycosyltransferase [Anaerolineae bacterium]|nr:glycosyltransferase [Anaerolineae bacterium]
MVTLTSATFDPSVSVIIPTYNRADMLARVLPSYLSQQHVCQVIIVDDGSCQKVALQIEDLAKIDSTVVYIRHQQNLGQPEAKNTGVRHAQADLVFIGEDDLELAEGHIATLVQHMAEQSADVIAGRRIWLRPGETMAQGLARADRNRQPVVNTMLLEVNSHARPTGDVIVPLLPATGLVRTEVARAVPFDPLFRSGNCWREETDFHLSLSERGYRLVFCPHTVSFHHARPTFQARQGGNRLLSDLRTLWAMYTNNRRLLEKHRTFIVERGYLVGGNIALTAVVYVLVRAFWMFKSEMYKVWLSASGALQ